MHEPIRPARHPAFGSEKYLGATAVTDDVRRISELLETASFAWETAQMALSFGARIAAPTRTLERQLRAADREDREAGRVACEALETVRCAFDELTALFDGEELEALSYEVGFWTTYDWARSRLFGESPMTSARVTLHHELGEARHRIDVMRSRLSGRLGPERCWH